VGPGGSLAELLFALSVSAGLTEHTEVFAQKKTETTKEGSAAPERSPFPSLTFVGGFSSHRKAGGPCAGWECGADIGLGSSRTSRGRPR
jgi:hypothetical protein